MPKKKVLILRQGKMGKNRDKREKRKANFFLTVKENLTPKTAANAAVKGILVASQSDMRDRVFTTVYKTAEQAIAAAEKAGFSTIPYQSLSNRSKRRGRPRLKKAA